MGSRTTKQTRSKMNINPSSPSPLVTSRNVSPSHITKQAPISNSSTHKQTRPLLSRFSINHTQPNIMAANKPNTPFVLPPAKLAHVVISTTQFKPMVAFYKTVLGGHSPFETDTMSFITYDDEHHRIAIFAHPEAATATTTTTGPPQQHRSPGLEHIAFTYPTLGDLIASYRHRKALGILPAWAVNHGPTLSLYYADPDGNQVEMQVDAFATADEATGFLRSPAFAENPFGVDVDPEDLARRLDAGEPAADLLRRPDIGPRSLDTVPRPAPSGDLRESYELVEESA
ncbi:hypothetical protein RB598_006279 [Gaeumannomyces tritici]